MTARQTKPSRARIVLDLSCLGGGASAKAVLAAVSGRIRDVLEKEFKATRLGPVVSLDSVRAIPVVDCAPDKIEALMRSRIEDGALAAEDLPSRLTRYGLMDPADFVAEMKERMELAKASGAEGHVDAGPGATECS